MTETSNSRVEFLISCLSCHAHNRAGQEIPNVVTLHPGELPISEDGVHTNAEGQKIIGKVTATAVEEFYEANE